MLKPVLFSIVFCATAIHHIVGIQIDNQLVTAKNDCFERLVLEAMIPFERTFRTTETNSVSVCENLCLNEGNRCQSFALGIHIKGNGTCQLSSIRIDPSSGRRPAGTIYDPDFDIYQRQTNCITSSSAIPESTYTSSATTFSTQQPSNKPSTTVLVSSYPSTQNHTLPTQTHYRPTQTTFSNESTYKNEFSNKNTPTDRYPIPNNYPTNPYGENPNQLSPYDRYGTSHVYQSPPIQTVSGSQYPPSGGDKLNFYNNLGSTYSYPVLYEHNYPKPNNHDSLPSVYAQNIPTVDIHYVHPTSFTPSTTSTNIYSTTQQTSYNYKPLTSPSTAYYPSTNYNGNKVPRPENGMYGSGMAMPNVQNDQNPYNMDTMRPHNNYDYYNKIGNHYGSMEPIETYFNPDDYYPAHNPCFRRVLAGKRISQQWVRRTLSCERVEDCQYECGHEKRFTCEGFNYKLDPSGHGQGICELIDVPLSEMDLYSRKHNREETLIYHPDYDYYERDRNVCRPSTCVDCVVKPYGPSSVDHYRPTTYRPPNDYKPYHDKPPYSPDSTGYGPNSKPQENYPNKFKPNFYDQRPPSYDSGVPFHDKFPTYDRDESPDSIGYRPASYDIDRYDSVKPIEISRPGYHEVIIPVGNGYSRPDDKRPLSFKDQYSRPGYVYIEDYQYQYRPFNGESSYDVRGDNYRPNYGSQFTPSAYKPTQRPFLYPPPGPSIYLDRDPLPPQYKKPNKYLPEPQDKDKHWGSYGGNYGGSNYNHNKYSTDYWGLQNNVDRTDGSNFNYFDLGEHKYGHEQSGNNIWNYPGTRYGDSDRDLYTNKKYNRPNGISWTRRPGQDECSVISSQGFRLQKGVIRNVYKVPTVTECERMCHSERDFNCVTYSYRYSPLARDNCLLCDRPINLLDYYADIEPDRDYDIYSMADDPQICSKAPTNNRQESTQCFFRAIDANRFFKSIVRDSLNVHSVGECEMECIKSSKFTCRAYSFRYGPKTIGSIIDNCQLSDWPVRDMDKDRHLIYDSAFDIFERASYGHGCEIQPIVDNKHKKLCYLGYGSPSKLLSSAIKKVISVASELDCKNECVRFRENTPFKCYSFSYGSQASSYNCEMSDLDQTQLKLNVHYAHTTPDRDYWLFAWNPFDWTCRDKVNTIGGNNRVNNDRRMDIFREHGQSTWTHYTVSGKPCRPGSDCAKNAVTGFYSCEIDGADIGSWDYCCKADYPCGYSQGFDYPWCFVGDGADQWRTCSDRYFPSASKKKVSAAITYTPTKKKNDSYHQPPPRPGGLQLLEEVAAARLWPVTYLYSSGPPNSTELSNFVDCDKENC